MQTNQNKTKKKWRA